MEENDSGSHVHVAEGTWRPLVVEVGALGSVTGVSKIAASVIAPLADQNVSVFCVSTNQEDYVLVSGENYILCTIEQFVLLASYVSLCIEYIVLEIKSISSPFCMI